MGLFGTKTDDDEWVQVALACAPTLSGIANALEEAGLAVGRDTMTGWTQVVHILGDLDSLEHEFKSVEQQFKRIGKPRTSKELQQIKETIDPFLFHGGKALHWGKYHFSDASGGPGQRALTETGMARGAARKRIDNNGRRFADNALKAAYLAQRVLVSLGFNEVDQKTARHPPTLRDLLVAGLDAAQPAGIEGGHAYYTLPNVSMVAAYLHSSAAILGLYWPDHKGVLPLLLARESQETASHLLEEAEEQRNWTAAEEELGLGAQFLRSRYSELHGREAMESFIDDPHRLDEIVSRRISESEAFDAWDRAVAEGLAVGIGDPIRTRHALEVDSEEPDTGHWREARDMGLDLPTEPDHLTLEERARPIVEGVEELVDRFYPGLASSEFGMAAIAAFETEPQQSPAEPTATERPLDDGLHQHVADLMNAAETAILEDRWDEAARIARAVLVLDPENLDARAFLSLAETHLDHHSA